MVKLKTSSLLMAIYLLLNFRIFLRGQRAQHYESLEAGFQHLLRGEDESIDVGATGTEAVQMAATLAQKLKDKFPKVRQKQKPTVVLRNLQKVLDKGLITAKGSRCHRNFLMTIGYSRNICPKSPKNVSHCMKYLEKNLKVCDFLEEICIPNFAKMG